MTVKIYKSQAQRRQKRIRSQLLGTTDRPRLSVFRSNKFISAQIIDDQKRVTLVAASEKDIKVETKVTKTAKAALVGQVLANKALKKSIKKVKFDRGSYQFHGRVKALAEAARRAGLEF